MEADERASDSAGLCLSSARAAVRRRRRSCRRRRRLLRPRTSRPARPTAAERDAGLRQSSADCGSGGAEQTPNTWPRVGALDQFIARNCCLAVVAVLAS